MKLAKTIEEAMDENGVAYSKTSKEQSVKSAMVIADMLADIGYDTKKHITPKILKIKKHKAHFEFD